MIPNIAVLGFAALVAVLVLRWGVARIALSRAKHPSLRGHSKWSRRIARHILQFDYLGERFYTSDLAPSSIATQRCQAIEQLRRRLAEASPESLRFSQSLEGSISDVCFTSRYRVPFPYRKALPNEFRFGSVVERTQGRRLQDLDATWRYDVSGSYGVNVFGYDFYKKCLENGAQRVRELGPVLGAYHPVIADNVRRLREISGLDEVSFHMSGTEAVMQAVRLARYHTGRSHLVRFCGSYHGWWGDVQPGIGNPVPAHETYTLKDMSEESLHVLRRRKNIACVLVNPLQALHPNANAPGDSSLIDSGRAANFDRETYTNWLKRLRTVCTEQRIVLIFDEVFVGFRLALGGAQEYFGVKADMVIYGKTLGGGLPVGVVCGSKALMKRFKDDRPADICFARGTFNSHPYVMGAMYEFLSYLETPEARALTSNQDALWNSRAQSLNQRLAHNGLPLKLANITSIWTVCYTQPSRYNWMLQYYLRAEGLALSWVGTGRLIFSLNYTEADFEAVADRFVAAAKHMQADGWWSSRPGLTNKAIKRRILKEMIAHRLGALRDHRKSDGCDEA